MITFQEIIGACIAVIVAGAPAMVALLKIRELHIAVNSALTAFIAATKQQAEERIAATKQQAEERIAATKQESDIRFEELRQQMEVLRNQNDQLAAQFSSTLRSHSSVLP